MIFLISIFDFGMEFKKKFKFDSFELLKYILKLFDDKSNITSMNKKTLIERF